MCGIVGAAARRDVVGTLIAGPEVARISRLRLRRHRPAHRRGSGTRAHQGQGAPARGTARVAADHRPHRHRAHALGHARRAEHDQRASDRLARPDRRRPQRHHRKPRRAAHRTQGARLRVRDGNRHRSDRASGRTRTVAGRDAAAVRAARDSAPARRVRDRGDFQARTRPRDRRATRQSDGGRPGRRRAVHRLRHPRAAAGDAQIHLSRRRRCRRSHRRQRARDRRKRRRTSNVRSRRRISAPMRSNAANTATTCSRKSTSSRRRSPTRSKAASPADTSSPKSSASTRANCCRKRAACT